MQSSKLKNISIEDKEVRRCTYCRVECTNNEVWKTYDDDKINFATSAFCKQCPKLFEERNAVVKRESKGVNKSTIGHAIRVKIPEFVPINNDLRVNSHKLDAQKQFTGVRKIVEDHYQSHMNPRKKAKTEKSSIKFGDKTLEELVEDENFLNKIRERCPFNISMNDLIKIREECKKSKKDKKNKEYNHRIAKNIKDCFQKELGIIKARHHLFRELVFWTALLICIMKNTLIDLPSIYWKIKSRGNPQRSGLRKCNSIQQYNAQLKIILSRFQKKFGKQLLNHHFNLPPIATNENEMVEGTNRFQRLAMYYRNRLSESLRQYAYSIISPSIKNFKNQVSINGGFINDTAIILRHNGNNDIIKSAGSTEIFLKQLRSEKSIVLLGPVSRQSSFATSGFIPGCEDIQWVNAFDETPFCDFTYITKNSQSEQVKKLFDNSRENFLDGCVCEITCSMNCECTRDTILVEDDVSITDGIATDDTRRIYECNSKCSCNDNCSNRKYQNLDRNLELNLLAFYYNKKGWGIRTIHKIPRYTYVGEYVGAMMTHEESKNIDNGIYRRISYMWEDKEEALVIDAFLCGNFTRIINHSCDPNLAAVPLYVECRNIGYHRIIFFTIKEVNAYDELTFDYGEDHTDVFLCRCGASDCRSKKK